MFHREQSDVDAGFPPLHPEYEHEVVAIAALQRLGFDTWFAAEPGCLRVTGSGRRLLPEALRIRGFYRFEGRSDPDDMAVVYALEARDGTRGILVDAYGTYADPNIAMVLDRIPHFRPGHAGRLRSASTWLTVLVGGAALGLAVAAAFWSQAPRRSAVERSPGPGQARPRKAA